MASVWSIVRDRSGSGLCNMADRIGQASQDFEQLTSNRSLLSATVLNYQ